MQRCFLFNPARIARLAQTHKKFCNFLFYFLVMWPLIMLSRPLWWRSKSPFLFYKCKTTMDQKIQSHNWPYMQGTGWPVNSLTMLAKASWAAGEFFLHAVAGHRALDLYPAFQWYIPGLYAAGCNHLHIVDKVFTHLLDSWLDCKQDYTKTTGGISLTFGGTIKNEEPTKFWRRPG